MEQPNPKDLLEAATKPIPNPMEPMITACTKMRAQIDPLVQNSKSLAKIPMPPNTNPDTESEFRANVTLARRALEDARMRFGKAIQAIDGGESCYKR